MAVIAMVTLVYATDLHVTKAVFAQPAGHKLGITIYEPLEPSDELRPGMVLIHGGGWRFGPRWQQWWYCRAFARAGYVVMSIDYRLMPRYSFPCCLYDCKAAVRWLRMHAGDYQVDPNRIVAFGASAGGHLAAFLAATSPDDGLEGTENLGVSSDIRAAISLYGVVDLTKYREKGILCLPRDKTTKALLKFAGTEVAKEGQDPLAAASPISYVHAGMAPVFLAHGMGDRFVHYEQSEAFYNRLRELGVPTKLLGYPRRNHGFDYIHWRQRKAMFSEMLAFLEVHNR
jgi:acetyl esterase/lipase